MTNCRMLVEYKAWANELVFQVVRNLPSGEATKPRQTRFNNIVHTLNHVFVIDDVFKAHLLGEPHGYRARNTETHPPALDLWKQQREIDNWYVEYVAGASENTLAEQVEFEFIGGGHSVMTRAEIILHIVNHGTYHRGFVSDLMYQIPVSVPANDLPVFLRERHEA